MDKIVLNAASCYNKKYFLNPDFEDIPDAVKEEIKTITVCLAEKLHCVFVIGFYSDGNLYFETSGLEDDFDYDEIGAGLEIKKLEREEKDLIRALTLWFIYKKLKTEKDLGASSQTPFAF